jgi:hypothetical protein
MVDRTVDRTEGRPGEAATSNTGISCFFVS